MIRLFEWFNYSFTLVQPIQSSLAGLMSGSIFKTLFYKVEMNEWQIN
jgi:hypothetical protein